MAINSQTINYDTISTLVQDKLLPKVVDQIFEKSAGLALLMATDKVLSAEGRLSQSVDGGQNIIIPLRYKKGTAVGIFSGHDVLDTTSPDDISGAVLPFTKRYYATINISGSDELAVSGDRAIANLIATEMQGVHDTLLDYIANDFYTGTTALIGLDSAIDTGTYGGINGQLQTWWQAGKDTTAHTAANMKDSTSTSYILQLLANGWASTHHKGIKADFVLCGQTFFDIAEFVANSSAQFTTPTTQASQRMADLGFTVLEYRGIPLIVDDYLTDKAYMGSTELMTLYYHPKDNFKMSDWIEPANQDAKIAKITALLQLGIESRRHFYRWTDLNN